MKIYSVEVYKNWMCHILAQWMPARLIYYVLIKAFAYTNTHECIDKTIEEIKFSDVVKSQEIIFRKNK